jgi:hypothetical protein
MQSPDLQQVFFSTLRNAIPANVSMVDEIAEVLNLGYDSVYRRIRGDKPISLGELKTLCDHFHVSLDQVLQLNNDSIVFQAPGINNELDFKGYLNGVLAEFHAFNSFDKNEMHYLCKDLPIWHFFTFPEIAAFKMFCWLKTIQNNPTYQHKVFSIEQYRFDEYLRLGEQILNEYNKIPSVELWSYETINSTINQIQYYRDAKFFAQPEDFEMVLESLKKMVAHLSLQAEERKKFTPGKAPAASAAPYDLYINEVLLGNNTILITLEGTLYCYINYNGLNYFKTRDPRFTAKSMQHLKTLISRSTYISNTGEKYRTKYFSILQDKIDSCLYSAKV